MGIPNTRRTGHTKLATKHPIHVMMDEDIYKAFHRMCLAENTTPTTKTRELIAAYVESRRKEA